MLAAHLLWVWSSQSYGSVTFERYLQTYFKDQAPTILSKIPVKPEFLTRLGQRLAPTLHTDTSDQLLAASGAQIAKFQSAHSHLYFKTGNQQLAQAVLRLADVAEDSGHVIYRSKIFESSRFSIGRVLKRTFEFQYLVDDEQNRVRIALHSAPRNRRLKDPKNLTHSMTVVAEPESYEVLNALQDRFKDANLMSQLSDHYQLFQSHLTVQFYFHIGRSLVILSHSMSHVEGHHANWDHFFEVAVIGEPHPQLEQALKGLNPYQRKDPLNYRTYMITKGNDVR